MNFLLEIGVEEIPHWMIPGALEYLSSLGQAEGTPRRLVIRNPNVPELYHADTTVEIKGPPVSAGEKAALGFAAKHFAQLSDLQVVDGYYRFSRMVPGVSSMEYLTTTLPDFILDIPWQKTMYWTGKGGPRFIRPIRWIVALLGDQVIPFEIAGVKSGNVTRGHRKLGSASIPVTYANYESELRKNFVILSSAERRAKIEKEAGALGAKLDPDLVETLTFITEFPTAIRGDFDPAYLELPAEVLTTVMRHHQKYFSVESAPGVLAPGFVAVMNTSGDPEGLVKHGNERVLRARFNDARFFWTVDQQKKLADRVEDLSHVTFQAKLGSYKEKTERVVALVKELGGSADAQRAALLAKSDLTTEMVKEFTDLQGIVGGLYAKAQGEPESVSRAIYEHYKPLSMEDSIPQTRDGQIVALADKLDTLRKCFEVGMQPTGSKDPFALRRAAQGVVRILVEAKLEIFLRDLDMGAVRAFLLERAQYYFREVRGFKYDEVNAVLASVGKLVDVEARLVALAEVRPTADFEPLAASFKRIQNILKQAEFMPAGAIDTSLLEPGPERDLHAAYEKVREASAGAPYRTSLELIASLRPQVDAFFDKVMVNVPDPKIRSNRLTLLHTILNDFSTVADFSEIVTSGDQKS
jgi:glycyl-tRNA synthetase beta chain